MDGGLEALTRGLAGQAALRVLKLDLQRVGCTCRGGGHLGHALATLAAGLPRGMGGLERLVLRLENNEIRSGGTRGLATGLSLLPGLRHLDLRLDGARSCSVAQDVAAALGALRGLDTLALSLRRTGLLDAGASLLAEGLRHAHSGLVNLSLGLESNLMQGPGLRDLADVLLAAAPQLRAVKVTWTDNDVPPGVSAHLAGIIDCLCPSPRLP